MAKINSFAGVRVYRVGAGGTLTPRVVLPVGVEQPGVDSLALCADIVVRCEARAETQAFLAGEGLAARLSAILGGVQS